MNYKCNYKKCKAPAEYTTKYGDYCPYHFRVLKKKKGLVGEKQEVDPTIKLLMRGTKFNNSIKLVIKSNGGKK